MDSRTFKALPPCRLSDRQRPPREWLTPLGWPASRVYWPAGYQGPVYPEIKASQLKVWGTLRASSWVEAPIREDAPEVRTRDGRKVGARAQVDRDPSTGELQRVVFEGDDAVWRQQPVVLPASWVASDDSRLVTLAFDLETIRRLIEVDGQRLPGEQAEDRLQVELLRESLGDSLFDVDPYDVLSHQSTSGFKTPFERDEASTINPLPRP